MWRQKQLGVSWVQQERSVGGDNVNAMLWQNGHAYNLNSLIAPTRLHLNEAFFISARGQIACLGTLPSGDDRVALVTPAHEAAQAFAPAVTNRSAANSDPAPTPAVRGNHDLRVTLPERILEGFSLARVIREAAQTAGVR